MKQLNKSISFLNLQYIYIYIYSNFLKVKFDCMLCENKKISKKCEKNLNINLPGMQPYQQTVLIAKE